MQQKSSLLNKNIDAESLFRIFAVISFLCMAILSNVMSALGFPGAMRRIIMGTLCYLLPVFIFLLKPQKFPFDYALVLLGVLIFYNITIIIYPKYETSVSEEMWNVVINNATGIVGYLYIRLLNNKSHIRTALLISSVLLYIIYMRNGINAWRMGYWLLLEDGVYVRSTYSMSFGYNMLVPVLCFLFYGFREKRKLLVAMGVIGTFMILMLGSRAAFFCVMGFITLYVFLFTLKNADNNKRSILIFGIVVFAVLFFWFYKPILQVVADVFTSLGFPSRTIERLIEGSVTEDEARTRIFGQTIQLIKEKPLFGHGFLADRYYFGAYCHNLFLELFLQFGIIGGGILSVIFIFIVLKMFIKCRDDEWKGIFLIFFSASFFRLLLSYSLWDDKNFWMMIGVFVTYSIIAKTEKNKSTNLITSTLGKT